MKYGSLKLRKDVFEHLTFSKLEVYPKVETEALPETVREGGFQDIIDELQSRFKANDSADQMKAYMELEHLNMTTNVSRYCLQLGSLTSRTYPDASDEQLSRKSQELVPQPTEWPEYLRLFTTMELAPKNSAYKLVKAMAQRCERCKEIAATTRAIYDAANKHHAPSEGRVMSSADVKKIVNNCRRTQVGQVLPAGQIGNSTCH